MAASGIGSERRKRILLIEDEVIPRRLLEDALQPKYELDSATDSQTALRLLAKEPPYDLVVSDLRIPAKEGGSSSIEEGWHVLQRLKDQIPFFVCSAFLGEEDILQRVQDFGALQTFAKPFPQEELVKAVDAQLNPEAAPPLPPQEESTEVLLARARERGRSARADLLSAEGGTLSKDEVAQRLHLSLEQLEERRRAGRLIGLRSESSSYFG